jgi:hypothetical protein
MTSSVAFGLITMNNEFEFQIKIEAWIQCRMRETPGWSCRIEIHEGEE